VQVLAERLRKTTSDLTDALKGEERDKGAETDNLFQD
jgi:hypothetical protein